MRKGLTILAVVSCCFMGFGMNIIVDDDGPANFDNIQAAINYASNGDVVIVQPGTYTGDGNRNIDFLGKAITVRSVDPNDPCCVAVTIVDCNAIYPEEHRGFLFQSGETQSSVLDGLTITGGYVEDFGGAIYCFFTRPVIRNCIIGGNSSIVGGGIAFCDGLILNCQVVANFSWDDGGGLFDCDGVIENCTITFNANGGAGAGLANCDGTIKNCVISNNNNAHPSAYQGSAAGLYDCDANIIDCEISYNRAYFTGGGLYGCDGDIIGCNVVGNVAEEGQGGGFHDCDGLIKDCYIADNAVFDESWGGGLYGCNGEITGCTIVRNKAWGGGGGASGGGLYACSNINDCIIAFNTADYYGARGGGLAHCDNISNCVIAFNNVEAYRESYGGGLYNCSNITNCTIAYNDVNSVDLLEYGGGLADCDGILNCIIYGNSAEIGEQLYNSITPAYSCIENWAGGGTGNIVSDPCFANPDELDFHLKSEYGRWDDILQQWVYDDVTSPCIDAGNPASDWSAELWPHGGRINMGAYGNTAEASMSSSAVGLEDDINNDGIVNFIDYSHVAGDWLLGQRRTIPFGQRNVDGDLSDWPADAQWIALDKIYNEGGDPNDVSDAKFSVCWNDVTNKIYVAVKVTDNEHIFIDSYTDWNASDRIEVYSQGDAEGGSDFWFSTKPCEWDSAQQYMVAPNNSGGYWATWGVGETLGSDVGLEYAVIVDGNDLIYEVGVTQFDNYGGITGEPTALTQLKAGHVVGFDVVVDTRWSGGFGALSENLMKQKYKNADNFRQYVLSPAIELDGGPLAGDINRDQLVDWLDLSMIAQNWLND